MIPYWKSKEMDPTFIVDFKKKQISKQVIIYYLFFCFKKLVS